MCLDELARSKFSIQLQDGIKDRFKNHDPGTGPRIITFATPPGGGEGNSKQGHNGCLRLQLVSQKSCARLHVHALMKPMVIIFSPNIALS